MHHLHPYLLELSLQIAFKLSIPTSQLVGFPTLIETNNSISLCHHHLIIIIHNSSHCHHCLLLLALPPRRACKENKDYLRLSSPHCLQLWKLEKLLKPTSTINLSTCLRSSFKMFMVLYSFFVIFIFLQITSFCPLLFLVIGLSTFFSILFNDHLILIYTLMISISGYPKGKIQGLQILCIRSNYFFI